MNKKSITLNKLCIIVITLVVTLLCIIYRANNLKENKISNVDFNNNTKVTNFQYTFYDLQKITIVPELWKRDTVGLDGTGCFGSCDVLDTTDIREPWANSET